MAKSKQYCFIDKLLASFYNTDPDPWLKPFVCLGVTGCNANTFVEFSDQIYLDLEVLKSKEPTTALNPSSKFGIYMSLCELFRGTLLELMKEHDKYENNSKLKATVESLQKYLENCNPVDADVGRSHLNCLKALKNDEETKKSETAIQTILACHLFSPLVADGDVILDRIGYENGNSVQCPVCKQSEGVKAGNTNYGCKRFWHGRADIVIKSKDARRIVQVSVSDQSQEGTDVGQEGEGEDKEQGEPAGEDPGEGEPATKRAKNEYEHEVFVEVKTSSCPKLKVFLDERNRKRIQPDKDFRQAISQTIVNSFLVVKENKQLEDHFVPSFLVTDEHIYINFYNVKKDVLLAQDKPFKIFSDDGINYSTVVAVWLALNFDKFPCGISAMNDAYYEKLLRKSGFINFLLQCDILEKYQNEVESGFTSVQKPKSEELESCVNPQRIVKLLQDMQKEVAPSSSV